MFSGSFIFCGNFFWPFRPGQGPGLSRSGQPAGLSWMASLGLISVLTIAE